MTMFGSQWLANAGGAGYEIDQSIRFNDGDSPYLNRTFGTPTSSSQFGYSFWVKLGADYDGKYIISANGGGNNDNFYFSSNKINIQEGGVNRLVSDQVFRDYSSWYHFVVAYDLGNATATQKLRVYLNGSEITSWSTDTRSSLSSTSSRLNAAVSHDVGANVFNGASSHINNWDGYIAEFHFVDGAVLTPTDFGEYNNDGVWVPIKASPTYGTNGFYITGATASDLGEDFSGNNNDFTSSGLTTADQMVDTPTNNFWTLNPTDPHGSNVTILDGNLRADCTSSAEGSVFAPMLPETGKWAWKITATLNMGSGAEYPVLGIVPSDNADLVSPMRSGGTGEGYGADGRFFSASAGSNSSYGAAWADGDVIEVGWDADNGTLSFWHNGSAQGVARSGLTGRWKPAQDHYSTAGGDTLSDFGQSGYSPTDSSYKTLCTANLPTPSITDGSAYMQTLAYASTGTSTAFVQDGNSQFEPGLVWVKSRTGANNHLWFDQVRGATKFIRSDTADVENTVADTLTSFNSNGFTAGADSVNWGINYPGRNNVAWMWAANGSGSSNTDGSITSTVSANTTAGFSIVKYTGTGANATVGHGLGVVPKMIFIKDTTNVESWIVYNETVGNDGNLYLNLTNAKATQAIFQNTTPTSSVFYLGASDGANKASGVHVAYCFAEIPGYSSIGSYTGNSSTDGPFVYTGFKPAFVMFKVSTNAPTGWVMLDNQRDTYNAVNHVLQPNESSAESSGSDNWDILSNGFKVRTTWAAVNGSGYTVTYMAFAKHPFGGDGAAPATAR